MNIQKNQPPLQDKANLWQVSPKGGDLRLGSLLRFQKWDVQFNRSLYPKGIMIQSSRKNDRIFSKETPSEIVPKGKREGTKEIKYHLDSWTRTNQDTCQTQRPVVSLGDWVQRGDLLADCASSTGGELSLGQNILVAYLPWEGYNFEDAILISERLVNDDLYTSVHIERYEMEIQHGTRFSYWGRGIVPSEQTALLRTLKDEKSSVQEQSPKRLERSSKKRNVIVTKGQSSNDVVTRNLPNVLEKDQKNLDSFGIVKNGSWVYEGDILVGKKTPIMHNIGSPYQQILNTLSGIVSKGQSSQEIDSFINTSLKAPKGVKAKVIQVEVKSRGFIKGGLTRRIDTLTSHCPEGTIPQRGHLHRRLNLFYRLKNIFFKRYKILPKNLESFRSLAYSKEGLRRRKRFFSAISHIYIYLAETRKIQVGDKMSGRHGNKGIVSMILPIRDMPYLPDGTPIDMVLNPLGVPSRMNVGQIYECLLGLAGRYLGETYQIGCFDEMYGPDASRSFVFHKLYQASLVTGFSWLFDPNTPGKVRIFDGRTGETFDQAVTVGRAYMLRLVHMVDDKMHMRSTGPYSLVTQQPLRGRSHDGGQRLGEMEVWAIEGYGAAYTLLEMLTIKSDDMVGRVTLWSNILRNQPIMFGTPESFKVLVCELQALCLDIEYDFKSH